jgi:leucyl-tRNA synthetase
MSKSRGNVVNPDDIVNSYGADSLRLFEMFLGPLSASKPWSPRGIDGVFRFLNRVWRLFVDENGNINPKIQDVEPDKASDTLVNKMIKAVTEDIEDLDLRYNTCISEFMIFVNEIYKIEVLPRSVMEKFLLVLSPFAPHIAEELWQKLGHKDTISFEKWPEVDAGIPDEDLIKLIKEDEKLKKFIEGKEIIKEIVVKNKLVNIVVRQ